jgi:hypothetical protein
MPEMLKKAGRATEEALVSLFNLAWRRLEWPKDWQRAYFMPLYKGDGSQLDPDNYRLLAISSVVMKLFEKILDRRIQTWSERVGILSDLQGGFRAGRGTVDQLFILNEITAIRREQGLTTFLCFIDVSKAYDRVWRPGLWLKLREFGMAGRCFDVMRTMYSRVLRSLLINGQLTEEFETEACRGFARCCPLPIPLCNLYQWTP